MTPDEIKLRPCPFCGSDNVFWGGDYVYFIFCAKCGSQGPTTPFLGDSVADRWNSRKPDALMYVHSASMADIFGFEKLEEIKQKQEDDNDE